MTDKDKNKLVVTEDGIYLKLGINEETKKIFTIDSGKIIKYLYYRNRFKQNKIGFNYHALKLIMNNPHIKDKTIYVILGNKIFTVNINDILNRKDFLHFKKQGYELQCFYPISALTPFSIRKNL